MLVWRNDCGASFVTSYNSVMGTCSSSSTINAERKWNSQKSSHCFEYIKRTALCVADSHWVWHFTESNWVHKLALNVPLYMYLLPIWLSFFLATPNHLNFPFYCHTFFFFPRIRCRSVLNESEGDEHKCDCGWLGAE